MNIIRPEPKQPLPKHAKCVFHGKIFDVYQWEQRMFDGSTAIFERLKRRDTATVIPITPDGRIIITKQEQPGMKPFISFPGGVVDDGEHVLHAAERELLEETGYKAKHLVLWDAKQLLNKIDWALYTFIAKGSTYFQPVSLDPGERITLEFIRFDELLSIAEKDNFRDTEVAFRLLHARANTREMTLLKAAWGLL